MDELGYAAVVTDDNPEGVEGVIARNVRRRREQLGLLQEEVARRVRLMGPKWSSTTVIRLERGHREPSLRELLALSFVLQIPLSELIAGGDGQMQVAEGISFELAGLRGRIAADQYVPQPHGLGKQTIRAGLIEAFEAEEYAARRLGRSVDAAHRAAVTLWGHTFQTERDRRLAERITDAADRETVRSQRGHISRQLIKELSNYFAKAGER